MSRAPALLGLVVLCACSSSSEQDGGRDAGSDGGRDAGVDASRDAGSDAGAQDAGRDGQWVRIEGLPDVCDPVEVAVDPTTAVPPLRFESCGEGCRQVVIDWAPDFDGVVLHGMSDGSFHDGRHAYFAYERPWPGGPGPDAHYLFVARDDGRHVLALRTSRRIDTGPCLLERPAVTDQVFAADVLVNTGFETGGSIPIRARFDTPVEEWARTAEPRPWVEDFLGRAYTSDTTSVFKAGLSTRHHRMGPTGIIEELARGAGEMSDADVVNDVMLVGLYAGTHWRVVAIDPDATLPRELVAPPGVGAGSPRTDGNDLVWLQLYEPEHYLRYARVELWASPFSSEPSELVPRRIASLPLRSITRNLEVGFGRAWVVEPDSVAAIYDLATNERREYRLPADRFMFANAIMGPEEMGIEIGYFPAYRGLETIRFLRYDSLAVVPAPVTP